MSCRQLWALYWSARGILNTPVVRALAGERMGGTAVVQQRPVGPQHLPGGQRQGLTAGRHAQTPAA